MNTSVLDSLEFPYPSVEHQDRFGEIATKVGGVKSRYQKSLADLEALYGALSQQAFKGELDLSNVPLPAANPEEANAVVIEDLRGRPAELGPAIHLPDPDVLPAALENAEVRAALIRQWLEAYCGQLGSTPFLVRHFMGVAQARLTELHPDTDVELGASDYEQIKIWVFELLAARRLAQAFDGLDNRIELRAVQA